MKGNTSFLGGNRPANEGEHWLSVSDLMAGLMMVFLFIAIVFMRHVTSERDQIKEIAVTYQENQVAIYNALTAEFRADLSTWDASIDERTLSFQFNSPEVLFDLGESTLKAEFEYILADFIPRYLSVLAGFKGSITEVRIEGHTSSEWGNGTSADDAYFFNMSLSQGRTRSVLRYSYEQPGLTKNDRNWVKSKFSAVGLASSRMVLLGDGSENKAKSRRVTFRILTNSDVQIRRILQGS